MDGFFNAYQALDARMKLVDAVANNLANAQTTGFKRDFSRILQTETGFEVSSQVDLSPGELVNTGNELDAAIDGEGFFVLQTPDGPRYTRSGSFSLNADGELMTKDGARVLDSGGSPIVASGVSVAIQDSGIVTVDGAEVARSSHLRTRRNCRRKVCTGSRSMEHRIRCSRYRSRASKAVISNDRM